MGIFCTFAALQHSINRERNLLLHQMRDGKLYLTVAHLGYKTGSQIILAPWKQRPGCANKVKTGVKGERMRIKSGFLKDFKERNLTIKELTKQFSLYVITH